MLRVALAYAERFRFSVFPCRARAKEPLTVHGCKDATCDPDQICAWWKRWPDANVAIATGRLSGIFVLDIDFRAGGDESIAALEARHGKLPETPTVLTPGGGEHRYFKYPEDIEIRNSAGALGAGLDVRGEGGYVIAPPSVHPNGSSYQWEVASRIDELKAADAPAWLTDLITRASSAYSKQRFETPNTIEHHIRNDTLFRLGRSLHARKLGFDEILATLRVVNEARCKPPLDPGEVEKIAHNAVTQADRVDFGAPDPDIARLAALSAIEYERVRKAEAGRLGVRQRVLDAEVAKGRPKPAAEKAASPEWAAPAAVADAPVDSAELLSELIAAIRRFVLLDSDASLIAALWILFTWAFEQIAETNPYLRIVSPTPECGKSTLLKVIKFLSRDGWLISRLSASSFTRTLGRERRTLLLDEGDAFLHENEDMRNLLDGANDPETANVSFSVKSGDDWNPVELNCFVPIAIASIGTLRRMQTVESRSITIHAKRATPADLKALAKGRRRELKAILEPIVPRCARWAQDNAAVLTGVRPEMPEGLSGREQDKWEPLIAIADLCGAGNEARAAAMAAVGSGIEGDKPASVMLLADIKSIFAEEGATRISSMRLCEKLADIEAHPWPEFGKGRKPITPNQLARLLRGFGIASHSIRFSDDSTPKGYEAKDFRDVWERYLPAEKNVDSPINRGPNRHNPTTAGGVGRNGDFQSATGTVCGGSKSGTFAYGENECGIVADENPDMRADHNFSADREVF